MREVKVVSVQTELDEKQARVTELIKRVAKVMGLQQDMMEMKIKVITKLPNSEQSYKGKVKTHNYIKR